VRGRERRALYVTRRADSVAQRARLLFRYKIDIYRDDDDGDDDEVMWEMEL